MRNHITKQHTSCETHVLCGEHRIVLRIWRRVTQSSTSGFKRFRRILTQISRQTLQAAKNESTPMIPSTHGCRENVHCSTMKECAQENAVSDCTWHYAVQAHVSRVVIASSAETNSVAKKRRLHQHDRKAATAALTCFEST